MRKTTRQALGAHLGGSSCHSWLLWQTAAAVVARVLPVGWGMLVAPGGGSWVSGSRWAGRLATATVLRQWQAGTAAR